MKTLEWVFPQSIDELVDCLKKDTMLHGGGTGLMRNIPRGATLADLSALGMGDVTIDGTVARIGGAATYARTAQVIGDAHPGHIIATALSDCASPALRNRITVGGSVALFPPWGRIVGPLAALDATVTLAGETSGTFPVAEYIGTPKLAYRTAITGVQADVGEQWETHWFRFSPTHLTYPLFTVTVLVKTSGSKIAECRIALTGNRGRYKRLHDIEVSCAGTARQAVTIVADDLDTSFPDRQGFSGEYLTALAAIQVTRGLRGGPEEGKTGGGS